MLLSSIVDQFTRVKILCIGDVMLDHFIYGDINRISPEAPVPVFNYRREVKMLGGAGNVVANCAALGCTVFSVCSIGNDEAGNYVRNQLAALTADAVYLHHESIPTIEKTRIIAGNNHVVRIDSEKVFDMDIFTDPSMEQRLAALIERCDIILLSDYLKGVLATVNCRRIITLARSLGKKVIIDPKGSDYSKYSGATLVKPNLKELRLATGMECDPASEDFEHKLLEAASALFDSFGIENLIITLSENGMAYVSSEEPNKLLRISTEAKEVYDVSGAGDTCLSVLGASMAVGARVQDAMKIANTAAGIVVAKLGTATVHPDELKRAFSRRTNSKKGVEWKVKEKILSREEAAQLVHEAQMHGKKVGFTNGCFDLLHRGHLYSFMQARQHCDLFIIGLNTDASIKRLKGESRPIQDEKTRALLLASLELVDAVVMFDDDTALPLVDALRPDVILKEGYAIENWPEAQFVQGYGGKAVPLERLDGYSTTSLVSRMKG